MNRIDDIEARWTPGSPSLVAHIAAVQDVHTLLARVRELSDLLRGALADRETSMMQREAAQARVLLLEAGLAQFGQHKNRCYATPLGLVGDHDPPCVCGLAALAGES